MKLAGALQKVNAKAAAGLFFHSSAPINMRLLRNLLLASAVLLPATAHAQRVLWYEDDATFSGQAATLAGANGWTIGFWNSSDAAKSALDLSNYDVLVIAGYGSYGYNPLWSSKTDLQTVRGNRTFLSGQDADFHETYGSCASCAATFLSNAVNWAAAGSGLGIVGMNIGSFASNSNSFLYTELLGYTSYNGGNTVIIPGATAGYPVNAGLTSAALSNWNSSYHETFATNTPGYTTINLSGDSYVPSDFAAVTILTESEAAGGTTSTPEPASMVLMATGLVGIIGFARRKRNS